MFKTRSYSRNQFRRWGLFCVIVHRYDKQLDKMLSGFRHINKLTIDSIDQLKVPDESIDLLINYSFYLLMKMTGILFATRK